MMRNQTGATVESQTSLNLPHHVVSLSYSCDYRANFGAFSLLTCTVCRGKGSGAVLSPEVEFAFGTLPRTKTTKVGLGAE